MELKRLVLLGIYVGCLAFAFEGSGADVLDTDNEGGDGDMSGDGEPSVISTVYDGSGMDEEDPNRKCDDMNLNCWCVYNDGSMVPNTKKYATAFDCSMYDRMPPTSTTQSTLPTRPRGQPQPNVINELLEEVESVVDDIIYVEEEATPKPAPVPVPLDNNVIPVNIDTDGDIPPKTYIEDEIDNNVPKTVDVVEADNIDEEEEEKTNEVSGTRQLNSQDDLEVVEEEIKSHPGILAALIGGGIVGLLCIVLIILFIIYRVRKKDEGSYPLGDEKPLNNYAYSKAPSREFYA